MKQENVKGDTVEEKDRQDKTLPRLVLVHQHSTSVDPFVIIPSTYSKNRVLEKSKELL